MRRHIARFFELPWQDRALLLRAFATVLSVRLALPVFTIERLRRWASEPGSGTASPDRVVWAVKVVSHWTPGTKCLASALTLQRLLSAHGVASELHIGVARRETAFIAHAWLIEGGRVVIGEQGHEQYALLTTWPSAAPGPGSRARAR